MDLVDSLQRAEGNRPHMVVWAMAHVQAVRGQPSRYAGRRKGRSSAKIRGGKEGPASRHAHWEDE